MMDKLKQLMEVKRQAAQIKQELENSEVEVKDVEGITIVISGTQQFKSVTLDESLVNPEKKENLESKILEGTNAAVKAAQNLAARKMKDITGVDIPGM